MADVRVIVTGRDYEEYVCDVLRSEGFNVKLTPASCDKGVDVLVRTGNHCIAIQCKLYSQPVGIKAVQEVKSGAEFYKCDIAFVVSPQPFTEQAKTLAEAIGVEIIHHDSLVIRFGEFKTDIEHRLPQADNNLKLFEMEEKKKPMENDIDGNGEQNELMHLKITELKSSFKKLADNIKQMLAMSRDIESKAKRGDIGALFKFARDGQKMELVLNEEIRQLWEVAESLGVELPKGTYENHVSFPTQQAKEILIKIAKDGNMDAQSKLLELIKSREGDEFILRTFRDAIKNDDKWVENMKPWFDMYSEWV